MVLKWGILSTAKINRKWIPGLIDAEDNELLAIASRDIQKAKEFAEKWNIPRAYGSYEELLGDPEIDAVYIPLPNNLHKEWILRASESKKHVLCEKPIALSVQDVLEIQDAAETHGCLVIEAFMYRFHPQTNRILNIIHSGELGEIVRFSGNFSFSLGNKQDIRWQPNLGGGSLWDVGCYPVSLARLIFGREPQKVYAIASYTQEGVDSSIGGILDFGHDQYAHINASFVLPRDTTCEIFGTKGSLKIPDAFTPEIKSPMILKSEKGSKEIYTIADKNLYAGEILEFSKLLQSKTKYQTVPLSDSLENIRVLCALSESAKKQEQIRLK